MQKTNQLLLLLFAVVFWSCKPVSRYTFGIKDFRRSLEPHLTNIVSKSVVMYYDSSLRYMATDKELVQLGQSEHPVLRCAALIEMLHRKSFNHFGILMSHLDDTAVVATDEGEFGVYKRTVSDNLLQNAR